MRIKNSLRVTRRATDDKQWERDLAIASDDMYGAIQYLSLDEVLKMTNNKHWNKKS